MVVQSIVIYTALIFLMISSVKIYSYKHNYQVIAGNRTIGSIKGLSYIIFAILSFSIIMGLRYDVGTDYFAYKSGYILNYDVGKGEIIFIWIRKLFNQFGLHFSIYFSFLAFLNISFFLFGFRRDAFILPLLVFFLFANGDWLFWMNGIRQAIAMCIWIFALNFIENRKFWWYLFFCIIAVGFHSSAIILIPIYYLLSDGKDYFDSKVLQLILLGAVFLLQSFFSTLLTSIEPLIDFYQSEISGGIYNYSIDRFEEEVLSFSGGSGIAYVFRIFLTVVIIIYSNKLKQFYSGNWFIIVYSLFFIGLITENIFPVGSVVLTRPFRYFFIFKGVMFSYFVYYLLKTNSIFTKAIGISLIIIFVAIFYLNIITSNENSHIWYQFYFED